MHSVATAKKKVKVEMTYRKYTWAANRISDEDMAELYRMKNSEHIPITQLVARAVNEFVRQRQLKTESVLNGLKG